VVSGWLWIETDILNGLFHFGSISRLLVLTSISSISGITLKVFGEIGVWGVSEVN